MAKKVIRSFKFHMLNTSSFFDLAYLISINVLTPALAQTLGINTFYSDTRACFDKLADAFQRNPTMPQTEELVETIAKTRRKMLLFRSALKETVADAGDEQLRNAKLLENVTHPYLKNATHDTQSALAANGIEMANALRTAAILPLLTQFGLKAIVDDIATLASEANEKLLARGKEEDIFLFLQPAILLGIGFMCYFDDVGITHYLGITLLFLGLVSLVQRVFVKVGSIYAVTNRRVIIKTGVISRRTVELVLAKCEGIQVTQDVLGRIFGYGSIVVTTGGATNCYYYVANPFRFKKAINMEIS
ncbi:MAG: PH domain-containing protein [Mediterranea sp.]|jgi:hypothetical protein|nr:PH domain-containing protein [Mediterranea sp.]